MVLSPKNITCVFPPNRGGGVTLLMEIFHQKIFLIIYPFPYSLQAVDPCLGDVWSVRVDDRQHLHQGQRQAGTQYWPLITLLGNFTCRPCHIQEDPDTLLWRLSVLLNIVLPVVLGPLITSILFCGICLVSCSLRSLTKFPSLSLYFLFRKFRRKVESDNSVAEDVCCLSLLVSPRGPPCPPPLNNYQHSDCCPPWLLHPQPDLV